MKRVSFYFLFLKVQTQEGNGILYSSNTVKSGPLCHGNSTDFILSLYADILRVE